MIVTMKPATSVTAMNAAIRKRQRTTACHTSRMLEGREKVSSAGSLAFAGLMDVSLGMDGQVSAKCPDTM